MWQRPCVTLPSAAVNGVNPPGIAPGGACVDVGDAAAPDGLPAPFARPAGASLGASLAASSGAALQPASANASAASTPNVLSMSIPVREPGLRVVGRT